MPVVAVIGAVALDAFAVSGAIAGTLSAFTAIAAVGATVGAIGVVARDKNLQTAAMVLGAVGAVGGLASGLGLIDSPTLFASNATSAVSNVATDADILDSVAITPGSFGGAQTAAPDRHNAAMPAASSRRHKAGSIAS